MELQPGERLLRQEGVHPGIFAPPAVFTIVLLIAVLPELFLFTQMMNIFNQSLSPIILLFVCPPIRRTKSRTRLTVPMKSRTHLKVNPLS